MQQVLNILEVINQNPQMNQKKIAEQCNISVGKVNYIMNDLTKNQYIYSKKSGKYMNYYLYQKGFEYMRQELAAYQGKKLRVHRKEGKKVTQAVVLAAGKRHEFGKPSGLLTVGEKLLLDRSLEILKNNGIEKIVVVVGYKKEQFEGWTGRHNVHFVENPKYKWTGSMASLAEVQELITDDFLLIEDDILIEEKALVQVLHHPEPDCVLITNESGSGDEAFVEIQDGYLYKISKDIHQLNRIDGEMVGISKISYEVFMNMLATFRHNQNPYVNYEYLLLDAARLYDVGYAKLPDVVWAEIDTPKQYEVVKNKIYPRLVKKEAEFKERQIKKYVSEALSISKDEITGIQPFGGMTNTNFKVSVGKSEYVLRIPGSGTEDMISRRDEMVTSNLASQLGIDAELLYFNEETGVKLAELIPNAETLNPKTAKRSDNMKLTANILKQLHSSNAEMNNTFNVFEKIEHYEGLLNKVNGSNFDDYAEVKNKVMRLKDMYEAMDVTLTACHNDTVPENFVKSGEDKIYLIDWEYGGMNDPMWDIAAHSLECDFSSEEEELFLSYYFNEEVEESYQRRIFMNKIFQDFLWSIWTKIKEATGSDFGTYGMDRYNRAKKNLQLFLEL
ncbi:NTP transferase domain-containing protein [Bacillus pseudomycoides]|uniref:Winged helix-turn-helix transcriptional regulator n=1 Tax=Bacillus pseudomycoides TaxID=64104 RepID=A0AAJ1YUJ2_9BACI|nr:NTP transferase domain-containing protein [Bacillus pseudomycoides]MDR4324668.1 winged helix-turn-helix transcriptional regulator [Bacillus pseudomycoides]MED1536687.1 NTP transferase domain-containing protein [Bacillus pseudomycoides]PFZ96420.1 LPS biosynthesis choline kinase [Bacillus pseudomycoides]PHD20776.1 LPS biosynthesis choline kinase [Bacillus pseudomycoides]